MSGSTNQPNRAYCEPGRKRNGTYLCGHNYAVLDRAKANYGLLLLVGRLPPSRKLGPPCTAVSAPCGRSRHSMLQIQAKSKTNPH